MNVVWFKRDLRITDHRPLFEACQKPNVVPLYILEPELWSQPDMSGRHYAFLCDCLHSLRTELESIGLTLQVEIGNAVAIIKKLWLTGRLETLYSHEETWNGWTYERDKKVQRFCSTNAIMWKQYQRNGVVRCLASRDGWSSKWYYFMNRQLVPTPPAQGSLSVVCSKLNLPPASELGLSSDAYTHIQPGGRHEAIELLRSFLYRRGKNYTAEMSTPVTAMSSCSRLSTHIAFGTLSVREVYQAAQHRYDNIRSNQITAHGQWSRSLRSFLSRLRWHCHFIQKLEDEPAIEIYNMHRAYDNLRDSCDGNDLFDRWKNGETGYPMVDACMRCLTQTGYMNFRMRALLMSFASYHCWLDWRQPALHLARLFVDYEPGIHYSQVQMQSATTGINSIRIYNPIKQGIDQDPEGVFIRKWVPELGELETSLIHEPWKSASDTVDYPDPCVDEKLARKRAADKLYAIRKSDDHFVSAKKIVTKHASRKTRSKKKIAKKSKKDNRQGELPL